MGLIQLQISNVRNLHAVKLQDLRQVNVFYGPNGAGKTSILEAVQLLGMGRSFRGTSVKPLISHERTSCTVFGTLRTTTSAGSQNLSLGVSRGMAGEVEIKVAGTAVRSAAELAEYMPLQAINADSFDLLSGAPQSRRQYLDWGVFHVEHRFFEQWHRFQRCIKQRNKLLRHGKINSAELKVWTKDLVMAGEQISEYRQAYFDRLKPRFSALLDVLAPAIEGLEVRYRRGWDKAIGYEEALIATQEVDKERGYTHVGPQRADIKVTIRGRPAAETLSRGQQKLVVCALKLTQGQLMAERGGEPCTYLLDDLPSELDKTHSKLVCEFLSEMNAQVFVTSIEKESISDMWPPGDDIAVFHVEHGVVSLNSNPADQ
jgi:DNA replication and repair protein RecF